MKQIRLTEAHLRNIINESINTILNEVGFKVKTNMNDYKGIDGIYKNIYFEDLDETVSVEINSKLPLFVIHCANDDFRCEGEDAMFAIKWIKAQAKYATHSIKDAIEDYLYWLSSDK